MKRIIVNADDFGINETVTQKIEQMILSKAVSSTTVMANGKCLEEVQKFAAEHPEVSFGVHLCLSEFESITKTEGLYHFGITDEQGFFKKKAIMNLKNIEESREVQNAIKDELNAQIDVVKGLGIKISHADSHHHVHSCYQLRKIFVDVLKSRGISKIRLCPGFQTLRSKAHIIQYAKFLHLNRIYKEQFHTTDYFMNYYNYLQGVAKCKQGQTLELMCHPGHPAERYKLEMKKVENKDALGGDVIELISYNEL